MFQVKNLKQKSARYAGEIKSLSKSRTCLLYNDGVQVIK